MAKEINHAGVSPYDIYNEINFSKLYLESGQYDLHKININDFSFLANHINSDIFLPANLFLGDNVDPNSEYVGTIPTSKPNEIEDGMESRSLGCTNKVDKVRNVAGFSATSATPIWCENVSWQKLCQREVPSSKFPGKMRLYVQSLYGSKDHNYSIQINYSGDHGVFIHGKVTVPCNNYWGGTSVLYTSPSREHFILQVGTKKISIYRLKPVRVGDLLEQFKNLNLDIRTESGKQLEAVILSKSRVEEYIGQIDIEGVTPEPEDGKPIGFGWQAKWDGSKLSAVCIIIDGCGHPYIQTKTFHIDIDYNKVETEEDVTHNFSANCSMENDAIAQLTQNDNNWLRQRTWVPAPYINGMTCIDLGATCDDVGPCTPFLTKNGEALTDFPYYGYYTFTESNSVNEEFRTLNITEVAVGSAGSWGQGIGGWVPWELCGYGEKLYQGGSRSRPDVTKTLTWGSFSVDTKFYDFDSYWFGRQLFEPGAPLIWCWNHGTSVGPLLYPERCDPAGWTIEDHLYALYPDLSYQQQYWSIRYEGNYRHDDYIDMDIGDVWSNTVPLIVIPWYDCECIIFGGYVETSFSDLDYFHRVVNSVRINNYLAEGRFSHTCNYYNIWPDCICCNNDPNPCSQEGSQTPVLTGKVGTSPDTPTTVEQSVDLTGSWHKLLMLRAGKRYNEIFEDSLEILHKREWTEGDAVSEELVNFMGRSFLDPIKTTGFEVTWDNGAVNNYSQLWDFLPDICLTGISLFVFGSKVEANASAVYMTGKVPYDLDFNHDVKPDDHGYDTKVYSSWCGWA